MHKYEYIGKVSILMAVFLILTGCQAAPQNDAVISKNDKSFDVGAVMSVEGTHSFEEMQEINYKSDFNSTDGSIHFTMDITQEIPFAELPLIQVAPHYLTESDAERAAYAIFPDTDFYEPTLLLNPVLTKSEILEKINLWSQYTSKDSLSSLYGDNVGEDYLNSTAGLVKNYIERYTMKYETAPEGNIHALCPWKMHKSSEYMYTKEELAEMNVDNDNDEISAQCRVNGMPYYYTVSTRNKTDFKVNMISAVLYGGESPRSIEDRILTAELCRTQEPSQEQVDSVKGKAATILSNMEFGQWEIDECKVAKQIYGDQTEYCIYVNAVPVFNGTPAIRHRQLDSLRNPDGYAASQYITDANFSFSANGDLISFRLYTPLNVEEVVNEHVKTMNVNALLERAQGILMLKDAYAYSFGSYLQFIDEAVQCSIAVSEMEYGLTRIKVPDQEDSYYYVPAIQLKGNVEYVGKESGKTYYVSESPEELVVINAIDGTIINSTNS